MRNCFRNFVICESNFILRGGKQIEERKMRKKEEEEEKERANFSVFWIESSFIDFKYKNRIIGEKFSA